MDRISELPPEVLHQILSLLPTKTAAQTAVLSKLWLKTCYTDPHLNFDQFDFYTSSDESDFDTSDDEAEIEVDFEPRHSDRFYESHVAFSRIVDSILERYRRENLPISDCNLQTRASQVTLLVESKTENYSERYTLLADTIFAIESLQQLELNHCKILKRKTLLSDDKISCIHLKNLTLQFVTISESTLNALISCSPRIETKSLQYCIGFNCIRVTKSLHNLLSLSILSCQIEVVHIFDAPKLLSFEYENEWEAYSPDKICLCVLNIGTCRNLRRVEFVEAGIDDTFLFELIPKYSSSMIQAIFDTPKLLSLAFSKQCKLPCLSFVSASSQCRISIMYDTILDTEQLMNLRRSLVELRDQVVDLTLPSIDKDLRLASEIDHLPPPEVDNLSSYCPNSAYSSYFDLLFSICWPKSLVIQYCDEDFGEYLHKLLLKEKERRWRFIECTWKEYLMNAEIEYKKRARNDWMTPDRKMLAADSRIFYEINTMCFKQTQRKEKNKYSCISRWIPSWIAHIGVINTDNSFFCYFFFALFLRFLINVLCFRVEEVHVVDAPKLLSFEYLNQDNKVKESVKTFDVYRVLTESELEGCIQVQLRSVVAVQSSNH
ncbi:hypothetical protein H5410_055304, partial [Solanum commersonii]